MGRGMEVYRTLYLRAILSRSQLVAQDYGGKHTNNTQKDNTEYVKSIIDAHLNGAIVQRRYIPKYPFDTGMEIYDWETPSKWFWDFDNYQWRVNYDLGIFDPVSFDTIN